MLIRGAKFELGSCFYIEPWFHHGFHDLSDPPCSPPPLCVIHWVSPSPSHILMISAASRLLEMKTPTRANQAANQKPVSEMGGATPSYGLSGITVRKGDTAIPPLPQFQESSTNWQQLSHTCKWWAMSWRSVVPLWDLWFRHSVVVKLASKRFYRCNLTPNFTTAL